MDIKKYFLTTTFKDSRDRMVYYDHFTKTAYRIPKDQESIFKAFQSRGLYSVLIFIFLYANKTPTFKNLIISGLFFVLSNVYFYMKMLPPYNTVSNFDLKQRQSEIKHKGFALRMLLIALYIASVFLILYLAISDQDRVLIVIAIFYSVFAVFKIIQNIFLLKRK